MLMFKKRYYDNDSINKLMHMSKLIILISVGLTIISSLLVSLYGLFSYGIIEKIAIIFIIIFDAIYILNDFIFYNNDKFKITDKLIFYSLTMFFSVFISEILVEVYLKINFFSGIIGIIGVFFGFLYFYFKRDELISRLMVIVSAILIYISLSGYPLAQFYFVSASYFNSDLWAQAFIILELSLLISYIFKNNSIISDFFESSGKAIAMLIFGIGYLITGSLLITVNLKGIPVPIAVTGNILLIISGIISLIAGILIVILSIMNFYYDVIKPRTYRFMG